MILNLFESQLMYFNHTFWRGVGAMHSTTHTQKESKKVSIPKTKTKNESKYLFNRCRVFPWAETKNLIGRKKPDLSFLHFDEKGWI